MKVLIVGSGLSGLVLAQALRKSKRPIDFEIFERDDGTRSQGWSVGLDKCLPDLRLGLPDDLPDLRSASPNFKLGVSDQFTLVDAVTHEIKGTVSSKNMGQEDEVIYAPRLTIRALLHTHLDVQYSKRFDRYQRDGDKITVYFTDGSSAQGDILVGADGSNSSVRGQVLPGFSPDVSPYFQVMGSVTIPREQFEPLLEHSSLGFLVSGTFEKAYCLLTNYVDEQTAAFHWGFSSKISHFGQRYEDAIAMGRSALLDQTFQKLETWPSAFVRAVKSTREEDLHWPPIKLIETVLPQEGLPKGLVTLVGDAAHSMVPFNGMGANTAIMDALDLATILIDGVESNKDLTSMLEKYHQIMVPRGRKAVLDSRNTSFSNNPYAMTGGRLQGPATSSQK